MSCHWFSVTLTFVDVDLNWRVSDEARTPGAYRLRIFSADCPGRGLRLVAGPDLAADLRSVTVYIDPQLQCVPHARFPGELGLLIDSKLCRPRLELHPLRVALQIQGVAAVDDPKIGPASAPLRGHHVGLHGVAGHVGGT